MRSGRSSDNGLILVYDPVMSCAPRRGILLGLQQPMQSLGGSELDTDCIALSTVNRLDRLAPAQAARQFYREHPTFPVSVVLPVVRGTTIEPQGSTLKRHSSLPPADDRQRSGRSQKIMTLTLP